MIKPVTFKAAQNFKANLYALEIKSRFIDQSKANGYYKGYGDEMSATVIGTSGIQIGSGAFLVQGRMIEIASAETVSIAYEEGKVGYVICRIETSPGTNGVNCSLLARTGESLSDISLTKENVYAYEAEDTNKVYELELYSFGMQNSEIGNVVKLISEISEITAIKNTADAANAAATEAVTKANAAKSQSDANTTQISSINTRLTNLGFRQGSASGSYGVSATLKRQGNYVIAKIYMNNASLYNEYCAQYNGGTLLTLPTYFRPKATLTMTIGGKGAVRFNNAVTSNIACYFTMTINTNGTVVISEPKSNAGGVDVSGIIIQYTTRSVCANVFDVSAGFEAPAIE